MSWQKSPRLTCHRLEVQADRLRFAERQNLVQHGGELEDTRLNLGEVLVGAFFGHAVVVVLEQLRRSVNAGKWGAEFMRDHRDEVGFQLVEFAFFFERIAQLGFGLDALGDVADGAGYQQADLGAQRTQADVGRELVSVFVPPKERYARVHWASVGVGSILGALVPVLGLQVEWYQQLNWLPDQLVVAVAEQGLCLRVDEHNFARLIDNHHRVRRRLQ